MSNGPVRTISTTRIYAACGIGLAVLFSLGLGLVLAVALSGCAETRPYSVTLRAIEFGSDQSYQTRWFDDGAQLVMTVHNDTDRDEMLRIRCEGAPQDWLVRVSARGESRGIGQLMNIQLHADPCRAEVVK